MTSNEIQESLKWVHRINDQLKSGDQDVVDVIKNAMPVLDVMYKAEIAYQLAVLNERIDLENKKFFGGLPSEKEKAKEKTAKRTKQV